MTQSKLRNDEYRQLLHEWCYLDMLALTSGLTRSDAARLKDLNALLDRAELTDRPLGALHSQEVRP